MQLLKTENQVYKDIISFINSALSALEITGWQVMQLKQPIKLTEIKPTIYVTCTNKNRRGWQKRTYPFEDEKLYLKDTFIQEIDVQISALRRRGISDTENTQNSADILECIKTYMLNLYSIQNLRALGYTIYQPSNIQSPDFFDDSDNFEFMPFFNVTFILNQSLIRPQSSIDEYTLKIRKV